MRTPIQHPLSVNVSCEDCVRHSTPECADCLVSFVIGDAPEHLTLSTPLAAAAEVLVREGLVPQLKYRPSVPSASQ